MKRARAFSATAFFPVTRADAAREDCPFYLDRHQRDWLGRLRDAWGKDAVIQIYSGRVRIFNDEGERVFFSETDLQAATVRRQRQSPG